MRRTSGNISERSDWVEAQDMLGCMGVGSAVYSSAGDCLRSVNLGQLATEAGCGDDCLSLCRQIARGDKASATNQAVEITCPAGQTLLAAPVSLDHAEQGMIFCCLGNRSVQPRATSGQGGVPDSADASVGRIVTPAAGGAARLAGNLLKTLFKQIQSTRTQRDEIDALSNSLAQSYEELSLLHRISESMRITQTPREFFTKMGRDLRDVVAAEQVLILWSDRLAGDEPLSRATVGPSEVLAGQSVEFVWQRVREHLGQDGRRIDRQRGRWPVSILLAPMGLCTASLACRLGVARA